MVIYRPGCSMFEYLYLIKLWENNGIKSCNLEKTNKVSIVGLSEISMRVGTIVRLKGGLFCYKGNDIGQRGVGFWMREQLMENFMEFRGIPERIARTRFKFKRNTTMLCVRKI